MSTTQQPIDGEVEKPEKVDERRTGEQELPSTTKQEAIPLSYRYLTFETVLPELADEDACPTPNLSKFTSPFTWSRSSKNVIVLLSCVGTSFTAYTAGSLSPAFPQLSKAWGVSDTALNVGLTTWCVGFAIAPMVLAPFSELNGRRPVFVISGLLFAVCQICCAVTRSYAGLLVARFFNGLGASMFGAGVGGVLADILVADERNTAMALFPAACFAQQELGQWVSKFPSEHALVQLESQLSQVLKKGLLSVCTTPYFPPLQPQAHKFSQYPDLSLR